MIGTLFGTSSPPLRARNACRSIDPFISSQPSLFGFGVAIYLWILGKNEKYVDRCEGTEMRKQGDANFSPLHIYRLVRTVCFRDYSPQRIHPCLPHHKRGGESLFALRPRLEVKFWWSGHCLETKFITF